MAAILDNPQALPVFIASLGGSPVEGETFRFELPLADVARVVPTIANSLTDVRRHHHHHVGASRAIGLAHCRGACYFASCQS
jgi:hypothetical protein